MTSPSRTSPRGSSTSEQLVEHRHRVARRSGAGPDDEGQHARLDGHLLLPAQSGQMIAQHARRG